MDIVPYKSGVEEDLAIAYNEATRLVPHCYPVSQADFAAALQPVPSGESDFERLEIQAVFVATDDSAIRGYIHIGIIRFFYYERGYRPADQALLEAAENYFRQHQAFAVEAFMPEYRYPFYCFAHSYLSNSLD